MTYLELVNAVLIRLREPTVSTVALSSYSSLIGKFVNDAKRQVEDAYDWNVLGQEKTVTTVADTYIYSLTGAGQKFRVSSDPLNTTSNVVMQNISVADMRQKQNFTPIVTNIPSQYCFEGVDGNGDAQVQLYGRPDGVYTIKFFVTIPQAALTSDSTSILVPDVLVEQNAYARALVERGEDGGLNSSEAYNLYLSMLADYIGLEATRFPETQEFVPV
ncbi:MAG: hypothetical protein EBU08_00930 [Micrococcales bacterium]|nr:hypothetical protein [Micrococcales bacterium]